MNEYYKKQNDKLDYSFLLISIYLFLIIFFVLLLSKNKPEENYSIRAKESIETQFGHRESKNIEHKSNNIFKIKKIFDNINIDYIENKYSIYAYINKIYLSENDLINIKLALYRIAQIINESKIDMYFTLSIPNDFIDDEKIISLIEYINQLYINQFFTFKLNYINEIILDFHYE